jgi:hypothetical protein
VLSHWYQGKYVKKWYSSSMVFTQTLQHVFVLIVLEYVTIACEGLQNLGLCSALMGDPYIVSHLLWHGTSVFPVSSEVASYTKQGDEDIFWPRSSRVSMVIKEIDVKQTVIICIYFWNLASRQVLKSLIILFSPDCCLSLLDRSAIKELKTKISRSVLQQGSTH